MEYAFQLFRDGKLIVDLGSPDFDEASDQIIFHVFEEMQKGPCEIKARINRHEP